MNIRHFFAALLAAFSLSSSAAGPLKVGFIYPGPIADVGWTTQHEMGRKLVEKGYVAPKYHAISHPRGSEAEAFNRLITAAELLDQPIMIFHVSTTEGAQVIRDARGRGLKVFAETCPQYLFLTRHDLDKPGIEGAKWMCSPPPREQADQDTLWRALALGDIQTVSSDHAPYRFDETGKLSAGPNPTFKQIANGLPGLETRLPLLFDALVSKGRPEFAGRGLEAFVELTATAPAAIYNLPGKGALQFGENAGPPGQIVQGRIRGIAAIAVIAAPAPAGGIVHGQAQAGLLQPPERRNPGLVETGGEQDFGHDRCG